MSIGAVKSENAALGWMSLSWVVDQSRLQQTAGGSQRTTGSTVVAQIHRLHYNKIIHTYIGCSRSFLGLVDEVIPAQRPK